MKKYIYQNKGITLVSLVITIIIMLILAGVSLSFLNGEYGVVTQAIQGKEATEAAQEREKQELQKLSGDATNRIKRANPTYTAPSSSDQTQPEGGSSESGTPEVPNLSFNETVPENGIYYVGVTSDTLGDYTGYTAMYHSNESFPDTVNVGDVFVYQDYEYRYGKYCVSTSWSDSSGTIKDWGVKVLSNTKESYTNPLANINNKPVTTFNYAWYNCANLIIAPVLPDTTQSLHWSFMDCSSLTTAPILPDGLRSLNSTFFGCYALKTYAGSTDPDGDFSKYVLPSNITSINSSFKGAKLITVAPYIHENITNMSYAFYFPPNYNAPLTGKMYVPCGVSANSLYNSYYYQCDLEIVRYCRSICTGCTFCNENCGH